MAAPRFHAFLFFQITRGDRVHVRIGPSTNEESAYFLEQCNMLLHTGSRHEVPSGWGWSQMTLAPECGEHRRMHGGKTFRIPTRRRLRTWHFICEYMITVFVQSYISLRNFIFTDTSFLCAIIFPFSRHVQAQISKLTNWEQETRYTPPACFKARGLGRNFLCNQYPANNPFIKVETALWTSQFALSSIVVSSIIDERRRWIIASGYSEYVLNRQWKRLQSRVKGFWRTSNWKVLR